MMRAWLADDDIQHRLGVAARVLAAAVGGYALTAVATVLLALLWPLPRAEAVYAANMLSFALYTLVVIWAFAVRRLWQVWAGLVGVTLVSAALMWWLLPPGAAP